MKTENKSVKRLEVGKDYINMDDNNVIVIDRVGDFDNKGFCEDLYKENLLCTNYEIWREATPEEVRERFEAHLVKRYGEDWKTMKIKEEHPSSSPYMIMYGVEISKKYGGWNVWNKNGLIYCNGIWVERLEEEEEPKKSSDWVLAPEDIEAMNKKEKATRHNEGKKRWSLVHYKSLEPLVEVLEFGAEKYGEFNWQKGLDKREILESMMRHLAALMDGEQNDKESGLHHIGHIMCNAMFYEYFNNKAKKNRL